jgi:hypothetical protein
MPGIFDPTAKAREMDRIKSARVPDASGANINPQADYQGALRGNSTEVLRQLKQLDERGRRGALDYMGHLANDDVVSEGHNVGMHPQGAVTSSTVAYRGYRTLPGSAADMLGVGRTHGLHRDIPFSMAIPTLPVLVEKDETPLRTRQAEKRAMRAAKKRS